MLENFENVRKGIPLFAQNQVKNDNSTSNIIFGLIFASASKLFYEFHHWFANVFERSNVFF